MAKIYYDFEDKINEMLKVTPLGKNTKNGNVAYVHDSSGRNPEIQICDNTETRCATPFGISSFDEAQPGRKNMEISLRSDRQVNFLRSIDEWNVKIAIANKDTWFPKLAQLENGEQQIKDQYHRLLIFDTSGKNYPPRLHTKTSSEELTVEIHDEENNTLMEGKFEDIVKGSEGIPIVRLVGYWFQPRQWGMSIVTRNFLLKKSEGKNNFPYVWSGQVPTMVKIEANEPQATIVSDSYDPLPTTVYVAPPIVSSSSTSPASVSSSILLAAISSEPVAKKQKK